MIASFAKYVFAAMLFVLAVAGAHAAGGSGLRGIHFDMQPASQSAGGEYGASSKSWYGRAGRMRFYGANGQGFMLPASASWVGRLSEASLFPSAAFLKADSAEFGMTTPLGASMSASLSLFSAASGRRDIDMMRHDGLALSLDGAWRNGVGVRLAYTAGRALRAQDACVGLCLAADGSAVPGYAGGVPERTLYGELSWRHPRLGFMAGLEARYVDRSDAPDFSSRSTAAYFNANAHVGIEQKFRGWRIQEFARIDNLTSRGYRGPDAAGMGSGRYLDYGGERSYQVGIRAGYSW